MSSGILNFLLSYFAGNLKKSQQIKSFFYEITLSCLVQTIKALIISS
tara:strand:- start:1631 stop:1771 length:141 start_codon:yes stop_codon:yes gene_type:complete